MKARTLLMLAAVLVAPAVGEAQSSSYVANPRVVEFFPSSDHNVTLPNGQVMVTRYEIRFFLQGAQSPVQVGDLGKPAPGTDGIVRASIVSLLTSIPIDATKVYEARVAAIGPMGEGVSTPSNPFGNVGVAGAPTNVVLK